jgi:transcription initiation factor TFIID subunit 6
VPPVLTCLIGRQIGGSAELAEQFALRDLAASLLGLIAKKYSGASQTLKPRLARSCLKNFLDPSKPFGTHYGAIIGLHAVGGPEVVRELIVPNLKPYEKLLRDAIAEDGPRRPEAEKVVVALLAVLSTLQQGRGSLSNGHNAMVTDQLREELEEKVGELLASRITDAGEVQLAHVILGA